VYQSPSLETNNTVSKSQNSLPFMEPEDSLPCLQLVLIPLVPTGAYSTDKASPSSSIFCQNVGFSQTETLPPQSYTRFSSGDLIFYCLLDFSPKLSFQWLHLVYLKCIIQHNILSLACVSICFSCVILHSFSY
jgi:hypothetical protein